MATSTHDSSNKREAPSYAQLPPAESTKKSMTNWTLVSPHNFLVSHVFPRHSLNSRVSNRATRQILAAERQLAKRDTPRPRHVLGTTQSFRQGGKRQKQNTIPKKPVSKSRKPRPPEQKKQGATAMHYTGIARIRAVQQPQRVVASTAPYACENIERPGRNHLQVLLLLSATTRAWEHKSSQ